MADVDPCVQRVRAGEHEPGVVDTDLAQQAGPMTGSSLTPMRMCAQPHSRCGVAVTGSGRPVGKPPMAMTRTPLIRRSGSFPAIARQARSRCGTCASTPGEPRGASQNRPDHPRATSAHAAGGAL